MPQILTECGYYMPGTVLHTTRNVDVTNLGPICKGRSRKGMRRECSLEIKLESLKEHILVFFAIQLAKFGGTDESKETNRNMENKN